MAESFGDLEHRPLPGVQAAEPTRLKQAEEAGIGQGINCLVRQSARGFTCQRAFAKQWLQSHRIRQQFLMRCVTLR